MYETDLDLTNAEDVLTLSEAAKWFPKRPSTRTIWRWANTGVRGAVLPTVWAGGRRVTTKTACREFLRAINDDHDIAPDTGRDDKIDRAEQEVAGTWG